MKQTTSQTSWGTSYWQKASVFGRHAAMPLPQVALMVIVFLTGLNYTTAQKPHTFHISFGRTNFTAKNTPIKRELLFEQGSSSKEAFDIRGIKGMYLNLGYQQELYKRLSAELQLTGALANHEDTYRFNDTFINGMPIEQAFQETYKLRSGLAQALLAFDLLVDEDFELNLGTGPAACFSRFQYPRSTTLNWMENGESTFNERVVNTKTIQALGYAVSLELGVALPKSLLLRFQVSRLVFKDYRFTQLGLGIGLRRY